MTKEAVINQMIQYSKEYQTDEAIEKAKEDLNKVKKILAMFVYNRLEGYKEISLVTSPSLDLRYKMYKR